MRFANRVLAEMEDRGGEYGAGMTLRHALNQMLQRAYAAAGNDGPGAPPAYPAAHPDVIAVTAIDERSNLYDHANIGAYVDLAAPGVDVMTAASGGAYDLASGTSFAAAHVSGVVALMLARSPRLTRERALAGLTASASDLGPPGRDERFGAGCVNAHAALLGMTVETSGSPP